MNESKKIKGESNIKGNHLSLKEFDQMEKASIIIPDISRGNPFNTVDIETSIYEAKIKEFCSGEI
jgi:hypothetical protein